MELHGDKLRVFFSGTFGKDTFSFNWNDEKETKQALKHDYRMFVLEDVEKLFEKNHDGVVNQELDIVYTGPFWSECDGQGGTTTTDCMAMMNSEVAEIDSSDLVVCLLTNVPSTGSCGEIMHSLLSGKKCQIFYQYNNNLGDLSIKARHWWIVAYAMELAKISPSIKVTMYNDIDEVKETLTNPKFYQKWKEMN